VGLGGGVRVVGFAERFGIYTRSAGIRDRLNIRERPTHRWSRKSPAEKMQSARK
jgi:hypothetical protein